MLDNVFIPHSDCSCHEQIASLNERIARLEAIIARQSVDIESNRDGLLELMDSMPKSKPKNDQTFFRDFHGYADRIVKLRADFFHNQERKKGANEYKIKLFAWLDSAASPDGNAVPMMFPMKFDKQNNCLLGHAVWKGAGYRKYGVDGTVDIEDHICALLGEERCLVLIGGTEIELNEYEDNPKGAAIKRWYWNRS